MKVSRYANVIRFFLIHENWSKFRNLIEKVYLEDYEKLQEKIFYFSNAHHCRKISSDGAYYCNDLLSDHEEADTKQVASVKSYE